MKKTAVVGRRASLTPITETKGAAAGHSDSHPPSDSLFSHSAGSSPSPKVHSHSLLNRTVVMDIIIGKRSEELLRHWFMIKKKQNYKNKYICPN